MRFTQIHAQDPSISTLPKIDQPIAYLIHQNLVSSGKHYELTEDIPGMFGEKDEMNEKFAKFSFDAAKQAEWRDELIGLNKIDEFIKSIEQGFIAAGLHSIFLTSFTELNYSEQSLSKIKLGLGTLILGSVVIAGIVMDGKQDFSVLRGNQLNIPNAVIFGFGIAIGVLIVYALARPSRDPYPLEELISDNSRQLV
jgi:hypothetical protein